MVRTDSPYPLRTVDGSVDVECDDLVVNGTATFLGPANFDVSPGFVDITAGVITATTSIEAPLANITILNGDTAAFNNYTLLIGNALQAVQTDASKNLITIANTGIGDNVLATSPALVTPNIGAATATSLATGSLTSTTPIAESSGGTGESLLSAVTVGKATNVDGGTNGAVVVQTGVGTTGFVSGTAGQVLTSDGTTSAFQTVAAVSLTTGVAGILPVANGGTNSSSLATVTVGKATNVDGGVAGNVPYQSGVGTTAFVTAGAAGTVLTSQGAGLAPLYQTVSSGAPTLYPFAPTLDAGSGGGYLTQVGRLIYTSTWYILEIQLVTSFTSFGSAGPITVSTLPNLFTRYQGLGVCNFQNIDTGGTQYTPVVAIWAAGSTYLEFIQQNNYGVNRYVQKGSITSVNNIWVKMHGLVY